MCSYREHLYSNAGKANLTFTNTLAFVCVFTKATRSNEEKQICAFTLRTFSDTYF